MNHRVMLQEDLQAKIVPEEVSKFLETFEIYVTKERICEERKTIYLFPDEWEKICAYHSSQAQAVNIIGEWWFRKTI